MLTYLQSGTSVFHKYSTSVCKEKIKKTTELVQYEKSNYLFAKAAQCHSKIPIYLWFCFSFSFVYFQTQSCGHVYILQTPLICPHLGIDVVNSTETNAIPVENVPTNGASTFWGKLIISVPILLQIKFKFSNYLYWIQFECVCGPACFYHCMHCDWYHLQSTNKLAGFRSSNFFFRCCRCRSIKEK